MSLKTREYYHLEPPRDASPEELRTMVATLNRHLTDISRRLGDAPSIQTTSGETNSISPATEAEVQAQTDTTKYLTPSTHNKHLSTWTTVGTGNAAVTADVVAATTTTKDIIVCAYIAQSADPSQAVLTGETPDATARIKDSMHYDVAADTLITHAGITFPVKNGDTWTVNVEITQGDVDWLVYTLSFY